MGDSDVHIIGVSLSEPHIDKFVVNFPHIYICCMSCHKSLAALNLHVLASFVNSKTIHKLLCGEKWSGTTTCATSVIFLCGSYRCNELKMRTRSSINKDGDRQFNG